VEAVGEAARARFAKEDLAFSSQVGGLKSVAKVDAKSAVKLPGRFPEVTGAFLAEACAAYRLLASTTAGDVVIHSGGESAVGQCLAQLAALRGVSLVSLVSRSTPSPDDAVELLKNIGATVAAPADYVFDASFRKVMADLGPPSLVLLDASNVDLAAVASVLDASTRGFSAAKAALENAHPADRRDAKLVTTLLETIAHPAAKRVLHDARPGDATLPSFDAFDVRDWLAAADDAQLAETVANVADAAAADHLRVWVEAYTTDTVPRALDLQSAGLYKHAYRQPVWLAKPLDTY